MSVLWILDQQDSNSNLSATFKKKYPTFNCNKL